MPSPIANDPKMNWAVIGLAVVGVAAIAWSFFEALWHAAVIAERAWESYPWR